MLLGFEMQRHAFGTVWTINCMHLCWKKGKSLESVFPNYAHPFCQSWLLYLWWRPLHSRSQQEKKGSNLRGTCFFRISPIKVHKIWIMPWKFGVPETQMRNYSIQKWTWGICHTLWCAAWVADCKGKPKPLRCFFSLIEFYLSLSHCSYFLVHNKSPVFWVLTSTVKLVFVRSPGGKS